MDQKIVAVFDGDTKRTHRFIIREGQGVVGNLYFRRGEDIPEEITIKFETNAHDQIAGPKF